MQYHLVATWFSTASCQSNITYIDGDKGILLYRGYPIEQLALECDFLEVCFLLQNGELPNALEKDEFEKLVKSYSMVHESMAQFMNGYPRNAHPMAVLTGLIGGMAAFYPDSLDVNSEEQHELSLGSFDVKLVTFVVPKHQPGRPQLGNFAGICHSFVSDLKAKFGALASDANVPFAVIGEQQSVDV